jgi:protein-L-isoaspartate O-methyltransferase
MNTTASTRQEREQQFWNEQIGALEEYVDEYERGPDKNTLALIQALEPLESLEVLDIGCGCGVLSAWLTERGATVTAIDLSPHCIARARELFAALEMSVECLCIPFPSSALDGKTYDRLAGRYVLHHLDLMIAAPALADSMAPGGRGAFLETMATNPLLVLARRRLVGRLGIPRFGTVDERPLSRRDLGLLSASVGPVRVAVAEVNCAKLVDRQLFKYRYPRVSKVLGLIDQGLLAVGLTAASYHQVVVMDRRP